MQQVVIRFPLTAQAEEALVLEQVEALLDANHIDATIDIEDNDTKGNQ
jgi:hypothetical protein